MTNPYSAPGAELTHPSIGDEFALHPPRSVRPGQGLQWLAEGFQYFKQDAGVWVAICVIGFALMFVLGLIPVVNLLVSFTTYIWMGGLILGCKAQHDQEPLQINHLFAGFRESLVPLLLLSIILMVGMIVVVGICVGAFLLPMVGLGDFSSLENFGVGLIMAMLLAVALIVPVTMLGWFAPALIVLHKVPIFQAMTMSFQACLKNILPFTLYGIVLLMLFIIAMIPFGLGMLVLVPIICASVFVSYKDIFVDE